MVRRHAVGLRIAHLLWLGTSGAACQLVGDIGDRRLADDTVMLRECVTNRECTERATREGPLTSDVGGAYTGTLADGTVPAMCLPTTGKCARLLTPDCPSLTGDVSNDNAVLLGTYLTVSGNLANSNVPRQRSAVLAAEEINSSSAGGGLPPQLGRTERRPLVVLQCDPSADPIRTATHLVSVGAPAVVGPNVAEDIISVTRDLRGQLLLMSPTAPPDPISNLLDEGLTWRAVPSDSQRAKLLLDQVNEVESLLRSTITDRPLRLAIPFRNDALGLSARDSISGQLLFNGRFISDQQNATNVRLRPFDLTDVEAQAAIAREYVDFAPDVFLVLANEVVANIAVPFEKLLKARNPNAAGPYYIATDVAKVPTWLSATKGGEMLPNFQRRVRGIGLRPDGNSTPVFASFNAAYTSRYTDNPGTSAMGPSYDSMYSIAYALAATSNEPVSPQSVAKGLRSLASGEAFPVGQNHANAAMLALAGGASITLRGTHSLMRWDFNGDIVGGTLEVWCIGLAQDAPVFDSSGKSLDVATQTIDGTYTQCD